MDFYERVRCEFLQLAALDPKQYAITDGNQSIEEISATAANAKP